MSSDSENKPNGKKVIHLDEAERLPAVPNSSQAAEVVKQIIEQILVNERRRARIEFVQISVFFLVFLFAILGTGIWFARQLLVQLREERQITEQTWRMMAGQNDGSFSTVAHPGSAGLPAPGQGGFAEARGASSFAQSAAVDKMADKSAYPAPKPIPPVLKQEEVAKLEQNISALSELLKTKPQSTSASVRDMLRNQQDAIQALSARLNEAQVNIDAAPEGTRPVDFIAAPLAKDLNLRMPIPSL